MILKTIAHYTLRFIEITTHTLFEWIIVSVIAAIPLLLHLLVDHIRNTHDDPGTTRKLLVLAALHNPAGLLAMRGRLLVLHRFGKPQPDSLLPLILTILLAAGSAALYVAMHMAPAANVRPMALVAVGGSLVNLLIMEATVSRRMAGVRPAPSS